MTSEMPAPGDGTAQVRSDLLQFLATRVPTGEELTPETDLLEADLLDSMLIMDVCAHVERTHGVTLQNADIAPRHFRTVAALADLVTERRA